MYTQVSQRDQSQPTMIQRLVGFLISKFTSRHGKRIIFITSLYFQVVRIEQLKADVIKKLNQVMSLSSSEDALLFPAAISGLLWKGHDISQTLCEADLAQPISRERAQEISARVVDRMPACIRYARRQDMVSDVMNLIANGELLDHVSLKHAA